MSVATEVNTVPIRYCQQSRPGKALRVRTHTRVRVQTIISLRRLFSVGSFEVACVGHVRDRNYNIRKNLLTSISERHTC